MEVIWWGVLGGLVAAAATTLGAVPALVGRTMSRRTSDTMLGFAAGAMLYIISHETRPKRTGTATRTVRPPG